MRMSDIKINQGTQTKLEKFHKDFEPSYKIQKYTYFQPINKIQKLSYEEALIKYGR